VKVALEYTHWNAGALMFKTTAFFEIACFGCRNYFFSSFIQRGSVMNVKHFIKMSAVLLGAALCLSTTAVMADMVTSDQMAPQNQVEAEKIKIRTFMDRAEVMERLQAMGVAESMSKVRVDAMTSEEIHAMAQSIDSMPAGGRLHDSDLVVILLIILLILII
jgi:hypothetical protein